MHIMDFMKTCLTSMEINNCPFLSLSSGELFFFRACEKQICFKIPDTFIYNFVEKMSNYCGKIQLSLNPKGDKVF